MLWVKTLIVSYQPAKFGGNRPCGSGDIMVLRCYVSSQDHMVKRSLWF